MKALVLAFACLHSALIFACAVPGAGGGGDTGDGLSPAGSGSDPAGTTLDPERLKETCHGIYACSDEAGQSFTIELYPGEEACLFDDVFKPGGYPVVLDHLFGLWGGEIFHWTPTPSGFQACFDDGLGCVTCDKKVESTPSAKSGECKGAASSCSTVSAGSCSSQKGCYMTSQVKYDGSLAYHCAGTPFSCSALYGEQACESQSGCVWE